MNLLIPGGFAAAVMLGMGFTLAQEPSTTGSTATPITVPIPTQTPIVQPLACDQAVGTTSGHSAPESSRPTIEVVFTLDTTGSMSGLIDGAKRKIWSIANQIATGVPTPRIRIGLVAYRDRGDEYVTQVVALSEDLDQTYARLMSFAANGGGDEPESVNQALADTLEKIQWDDDPATLRLVYLVGDAPPHMDYPQDVSYLDSCTKAAQRGIVLHTVQCGASASTASIWQEIARRAEGEYFALQQDGGMVAAVTPLDAEIATLGDQLTGTLMHYGDAPALAAQWAKAECSEQIAGAATVEAKADRAEFNSCDAGLVNLTGDQELVRDVSEGRVDLEKIPVDQLPAELQVLDADQRLERVREQAKNRTQLQKRILELSKERALHLQQQVGTADQSFDRKVLESLQRQADKKGIRYAAPEGEPNSSKASEAGKPAALLVEPRKDG